MDRQLVSCIRGGLGRQTGLGFVAAAVLALVLPASGLVTFSGRNGVLLLSSSAYLPPFVTRAPLARLADCTMNPAWRLWTVRPAGSHHTDLGPGDSGLFSPGGGRLAVTSSGDPCSFASPERQGPGLYLGSAAGSDLQSIKGDKLVGWLPTGRLVVAEQAKSAKTGLEVGGKLRLFDPVSGLQVMSLSNFSRSLSSLSISCIGRVAAVRTLRSGAELDVFTRTGAQRVVKQRVAIARYGLDHPQWAPDGRTLLFDRHDTGGSQPTGGLWRVSVNGRDLRRLTRPRAADDTGGLWAPGGRRVLFTRSDGHGSTTLVINSDGSRSHIVGSGPAVWSPDAKLIAMVAHDLQGENIAIVNATTGARQRRIALTEGQDWFGSRSLPDWQALPGGHPVRCADRGSSRSESAACCRPQNRSVAQALR